jgi:flagellar basal-body rod protein FlgC
VDYRTAMAVSRLGMDVEKLRLETAAMNLANVSSTSADPTKRYAPRRVVSTGFIGAFDLAARHASGLPPGVRIETMEATPRLTYDPGHPDADAAGYVSYPGVDHINEMMTLNVAMRTYQANVAAAAAAKSMAHRALEIGGGQ